ncbi:hypothetical protein [Nostoc sp. FACHB-888]|nr:hypothetical protein [Nostoc sp. FACHB-888]MBD2249545.1 hypothetical protein [Nostoc sp. FACHB-888]
METAKVNLIVNATIQKLPHCMKAVSERELRLVEKTLPEWLIASMKE